MVKRWEKVSRRKIKTHQATTRRTENLAKGFGTNYSLIFYTKILKHTIYEKTLLLKMCVLIIPAGTRINNQGTKYSEDKINTPDKGRAFCLNSRAVQVL